MFCAQLTTENSQSQAVLKLTVAGDYAMSTARQSSERPPRSEIPCHISRTGYATRRPHPRGQQCGFRLLGDSKGTSLVGVRSTFDIRRFPARSTKSRGSPAVATVKTSSSQIHRSAITVWLHRRRQPSAKSHSLVLLPHVSPLPFRKLSKVRVFPGRST